MSQQLMNKIMQKEEKVKKAFRAFEDRPMLDNGIYTSNLLHLLRELADLERRYYEQYEKDNRRK
ncbi:hypothetical protein [Listeria sp. ILCC797]|uniref:hypothetical protein n=1 Tax=Listeria sp. ILCC797 TaxID=1918333 RepID=UPI000B58F55B|nr:hypothetical protein [Listeria sp. ILCC797]